ncbi:MAG: hypothetical protein ABIA76_06060 [Candidatus Diapherotrites archaeon]
MNSRETNDNSRENKPVSFLDSTPKETRKTKTEAATASSPAHITGFFKIYSNGSTGAGINLDKGMITKVELKELKNKKNNTDNKNSKNSIEINLNGKKCSCKTSLLVAKKMLSLKQKKIQIKSKKFKLKNKKNSLKEFRLIIFHETKFPVGYGLGISGAGALSLSLALNKALKLKLSKKECLEISQKSEIESGTGLGDVVAEQFSGAMMGAKPFPSKKVIPIKCPYKFIVLGFFSPINTKKIIFSKKWKKKINEFGSIAMKELMKEKTFQNLVLQSRNFTFRTKLFSNRLLKALEFFPFSSMSMLGQTIFIPSKNPKQTEKELKKFTSNTLIVKIAEQGAKVL